MRRVIVLLLSAVLAASSLTSKIKNSIEKWDRNAYTSLFGSPDISGANEIFLLRPKKVIVKKQKNILKISILRKPFPFLQVWRIETKEGKIIKKEVLASLGRIAFYGPEDSRCYVLKKADVKLPDLNVKFNGGVLCEWPDSFLFRGNGIFSFRPSSFVERKNLFYLFSKEELREKVSFLLLRIQRKSGADVKFSIGPETSLTETEKKIFQKYSPWLGKHFSKEFKNEIFRPVPKGGAFVILGGSHPLSYTYNPQSEKEIFVSDIKKGRYISLYTSSKKMVLLLPYLPSGYTTGIKGEIDPYENIIKAEADINFGKEVSKPIYFSLSPELIINKILDENGREIIFTENSGNSYKVYPNGCFQKLTIKYTGKISRIDSFSNLWGGFFFPTLWYPYFGDFHMFFLNLKLKRGKSLLSAGKKIGSNYVSEVPVSYIPIVISKFRGKEIKDGLEIYWERRNARAISEIKEAYKKALKLFGKPSWTVRVALRVSSFYFGSSSTGLINLEILPPKGAHIYSPYPMICGRKSLVTHEILHQWWGGLTKPYSLSEYWINEGMVTLLSGMLSCEKRFEKKYRATFIGDKKFPPLLLGGRIGYYSNSIKELFKHLHYRAALVIDMARIALGDEDFLKASREFLEKYKFKKYRWKEFADFFEKKIGKPGFFNPWVYTYFTPKFTYKLLNGKLIIEEKTPLKIEGKKYHFQIPVPVEINGKRKILWVDGNGKIKVKGKFKIRDDELPARFYYSKYRE